MTPLALPQGAGAAGVASYPPRMLVPPRDAGTTPPKMPLLPRDAGSTHPPPQRCWYPALGMPVLPKVLLLPGDAGTPQGCWDLPCRCWYSLSPPPPKGVPAGTPQGCSYAPPGCWYLPCRCCSPGDAGTLPEWLLPPLPEDAVTPQGMLVPPMAGTQLCPLVPLPSPVGPQDALGPEEGRAGASSAPI